VAAGGYVSDGPCCKRSQKRKVVLGHAYPARYLAFGALGRSPAACHSNLVTGCIRRVRPPYSPRHSAPRLTRRLGITALTKFKTARWTRCLFAQLSCQFLLGCAPTKLDLYGNKSGLLRLSLHVSQEVIDVDHLALVLVLLLLGAFLQWPHSRIWGYGPSGVLGLLLVIVLIMAVVERAPL
jgi:hypothetical protein